MYRILIADDEKIGRHGVHFLLDQMNIDFEIEEARNGKSALEIIKNRDFDILLTDIKMPFMDGIELIKEAVTIQPGLKIAIFSGYGDFEYAKTALSLGVIEYILKPVDPDEFKVTIEKMIKQVDEARQNGMLVAYRRELIKEHILFELVSGQTDEFISQRILEGNLEDYIGHYHRMMLLETDDNLFQKAAQLPSQLLEVIPIKFDYLNLNMNQSLLFFEEDHVDKLEAIAVSIDQYVSVQYNTHVYLAISDHFERLDHMDQKVNSLELLLSARYYHPGIYIYSEYKQAVIELNPYEDMEELSKRVRHEIKLRDADAIRQDFTDFISKYGNQNDYTRDYIKFLSSTLIKDIYSALIDTRQKEMEDMIVQFYRTDDVRQLNTIVNKLIDLLEKEFKKSESLVHSEVQDVIRYIYAHYNLDLSVDLLAEYVCLAPSYLSHIFKKETGENLGKFIKRVRMEKASDMLKNTHEKIVTVAVAVGYNNVSYFCQSFREYYGISPQKYRNQGE